MLATKQAKQAKQSSERVTFQNILFATDFLPGAQAAFPYAASLAKSFGSKLYALHVNEPINYALPPEAWVGMQTAVEAEKKALRERFQRECPEIARKIIEAEGEIWTAVETAIEKYEIDLIVVGTRGRTGLEKVLLGSKAEEILRRAQCPVLTVGPDVPGSLGTRGKIGSILCATQFGLASLKASCIAVSLAEEFQAKLTVQTVLPASRNNNQAGPQEEIAEANEEELRRLVPEDAKLWCTPHFMVEYGNQPADKILHRAQEVGAELIVLGAHKLQGVPGAATHLPTSTIHRVIAHANCPVLTVRG
jgi:nucleotide-binding universal stress UspA family protein